MLLFIILLHIPLLTLALDDYQREYCSLLSPPRPKQLIVGSTFGRLIGFDPQTGCYCRERIERFAICYGRARCTSMTKNLLIQSYSLKITNTHIQRFKYEDFEHLPQLLDLQIEGNYDLERISNETFSVLAQLRNLSIAYNMKLKYLEIGAFEGLISLEQLFLNNNALSTLYDTTRSFEPLKNLVNLVLDSNRFYQIGIKDFNTLSKGVKIISLDSCRISEIDSGVFRTLKQLQQLLIGENFINTSSLVEIIHDTNLQGLSLNSMGFQHRPPLALMEIIGKNNISAINLSKNQFDYIDNQSFPIMVNIKILDLRECTINTISDDAFEVFPKLKSLLISGNRLSIVPQGVLKLHNLMYLDMHENSPNINYHIYFNMKETDFQNMTNLIYLNMGYIGVSHLFTTSFKGLTSLEVLILKNASIFYMEQNTFAQLNELRVLNLMNNRFGQDNEVPDVFFNLFKLEQLSLSNCNIKYIIRRGINPFRNLVSLKNLKLDHNLLVTLNSDDLQTLPQLQSIDLSFNSLNSWENRWFSNNFQLKHVKLVKNKLTDITVTMLEDFSRLNSLELDQNSILCKCLITYKSYQKWTNGNSNVTLESLTNPPVYCGYPDNLDNVTLLDFYMHKGGDICRFYKRRLFLYLPLFLISLLLIIMAVLAFVYRWHIKYWLFLAKLYLIRKGKLKGQPQRSYTNYEYDAFISYSNEDRDFVMELVTIMEKKAPFHRLCVYERDFNVGTIISESVLESVAKSRKTVLIVSENYAKSQWCRWESQICEHHRLYYEDDYGEYVDDSLILIKLSPVSRNHLTATLKYLLKTRIYLQWVEEEDKKQEFWNKLKDTLGPPISPNNETN